MKAIIKNKNKKLALIFFAMSIFFASYFVFAQTTVSPQIDISAYVLDKGNNEIQNGTYSVRFAIYNSETGGSSLWQETQEVEIVNGVINAYLGANNALSATLNFTDGTYYIGIRINNDSEMTPRKKIGAVPLAINAYYLNGATTGTNKGDIPLLGASGLIDANMLPDLSTLGVISTGTWEADIIGTDFGGTGTATLGPVGSVPYSDGTTYAFSAQGTAGQVLVSGGAGVPTWGNVNGSVITPDSLDFTELADIMTLDNNLTIDTNGFDFDIDGTLSANSLIISGQATLGTLGLNLYTNTSFIPETNGLNLGSAANHWANLYVDNISVGGTDMAGTTSEYFTINTDSVAEEDMGLRFYRGALDRYAALAWDGTDTQFNLYEREDTSEFADLNLQNLYANGNVGIGTDNPNRKLELAGPDQGIRLKRTSGDLGEVAGLIEWADIENNIVWQIESGFTSQGFSINEGDGLNKRLFIAQGGNVGIGDATPASLFTVGNNDLFQVNSSGQIAASTGISTSGAIVSTLVTGTAPFTIASTTVNANLNADLLDGSHASAFQTALGFAPLDIAGSNSMGANLQLSGNTLLGNSTSGGNLTLSSTSHATKGKIIFGTSGYDEVNNWLGIGTASPGAKLEVAQTAAATGALKGLIYTGAVNTNQTASTEIPSLTLTTAGRQWAMGALATQREVLITAPTYSFVGASTITDAATLAIAGAPIKSTNASITNTHGLLIQAGAVSMATNSYGLTVNAQTGATNNYAAAFLGGNVGIGTASPASLLTIFDTNTNTLRLARDGSNYSNFNVQSDGSVQLTTISASLNESTVKLGSGAAHDVAVKFDGNAQDYSIGVDYSDSDKLIISNNLTVGTSPLMTITSTGNIGIGTTNPGGGTGNSVLTLANSSVVPTALANTTHLYSSAGEGYWMDAAGNAALQTPHDLQTGKWIFSSTNVNTERILRVEMEDLTKELDTILGGGYVFENGEAVYQGENILAGIDARLSEQGTIVSDLTLKTSENISTLQELQDSVDEQFNKISNFSSILADKQLSISNEIQNLNDQIANYNLRITSVEDFTVKLQEQIDELKKLTNTELNLVQIEANKTDIEYLKLVLGLDRAENGSLNLLGNLEADGVVAGAFSVKISDEEKKTIGNDYIEPVKVDADGDGKDDNTGDDGKSYLVKTKALTEKCKIFTTFEDNPGSANWVEKVKDSNGDYTGFKMILEKPIEKRIYFGWWIVEEK